MKTIKPQKLGVLTRAFENGDSCYFSVSVLVFFPFAAPYPLLAEVDLWKFVAGELGDEPLDAAMPKTRGEILVTGSAYPSGGPRPACAPRVAVGAIDKTLYVAGDRYWKGNRSSDPIPFTEMPIDYEHAFGGKEYAENPIGKGLVPVETEYGELHPLPNVEDPKRPLVSPKERPVVPAGFGPYDFTWPERYAKVGTYDAAWLKERFPGFAADMDWSIWNAAPADQQIKGFFQGDEPFTLDFMHPEKARLDGRLPGVATRVFVTQKSPEGEAFREIPTRLDTIRFFPKAERGVLIFRGTLEVAEDDAADIVHLVLGCEDMGSPKPSDHYREVLRARLDKDKGYLLGLKDSDLMPAKRGAADVQSEDIEEMTALVSTDGLLRKNMRKKVEIEHEKAKKQMLDAGLDPSALPPLPPEEEAPALDDLPEKVAEITEKAEKAKADAEKKQAEAESQLRAMCAARGLDYEAIKRDARAKAGGPPKPMAPDVERMKARSAEAKARGLATPELDAVLSDPGLDERVRMMDTKLREAYQRFAHHFPEAARLEGEPKLRVRNEVVQGRQAGKSFAGCDLTGADLSGLDLTKADFKEAFLECVDFTGAQLGGADFTGAVLSRANLTRANLFGAKLAGANLGAAKLNEAEVGGGVDLAGAVLAKADLSGARFSGAEMKGVDLSEAVLAGADFTGAKTPEVNFIKTNFVGVKLAGVDMSKCNFIEAILTGVDFTGAKLVAATFITVKADGAIFRDADLTNLRVVKESSFEGADFKGAHLQGANLRGTKLRESDFSGALLDSADLSECDLHGAVFTRASAKGAQLVRADLTAATMASVNLMEGSLQKANLAGTDLRGANLFRVDLAKAQIDAKTNFTGANVKRARVVTPRKRPSKPPGGRAPGGHPS